MKTSKVALAIGLGCSVVFGGVVLVATLFYIGVKGVSSRAPTKEEQRLILDIAALGDLEDELDPKCQKMRTKRNIDGSLEIELDYDCAGDNDTFFMTSAAEIAPHERGARETYTISIGAFKAGLRIGGATIDPQQHLLDLGDQHYAGYVRKDGNIIGNVFLIRQGRVVHSLVMSGLYYDDPEAIRELLAPLVEESKKQFGS